MDPLHVRHAAFVRHVPPGSRRERLGHVAMSTPLRLAEAPHCEFVRVGFATQAYLSVPLYARGGSLWTSLWPEPDRFAGSGDRLVDALEGRIPAKDWPTRMRAHFEVSPVLARNASVWPTQGDVGEDGLGRVGIDGRDRSGADLAKFMARSFVMTERGPMGRIDGPIAEANRIGGGYRLSVDPRRTGDIGRFISAARFEELVALDGGVPLEGDLCARLGIMRECDAAPDLDANDGEDLTVLANLLPGRLVNIVGRMLASRRRDAAAEKIGPWRDSPLLAWEAVGSTGSITDVEVPDVLADCMGLIELILPLAHSDRPFLLRCERYLREIAIPRLEAAPAGPDSDALAALAQA